MQLVSFEKDTIWWSDELYEILGFDKTDLPPNFEAFLKRLPKEDAKTHKELVERAAKHGKGYLETFRYQIPGKKMKHIFVKAEVILDDNNKPKGLKGTSQDVTERILAENEIRNQKELFEMVINAVPSFIFWKDKDLNYLGCNTSFAQYAGLEKSGDIIGKSDYDMVWGAEAEKYRVDDRQVIDTVTEKREYDESVLDQNGNRHLLHTNKMPLTNSDGDTIGVIATCEDITERKEAVEKIKASEAKFRGVFEESNVGIALGSADGTVIEVNDEYLKITGYTREEFINLNYADITHPEDLAKEIPLFEQLLKGEIENYRIEKRLLAKNGEYRWLDAAISSRRDKDGNVDLTIALVIDIHEGKRANEMINVFFEQPMNIHLIGTIQGKITKINEGWVKTLGYTKDETIGKNIMDFIHPDDQEPTVNELKELESGKKTFYFENRYRHKNGTYISLAWSAIYNTSGKLLHGVAKDISQQKAFHEQLIKSEDKYKALSENAKHIILTHTLQGEITYVNKFVADFMNMPKEQIIGLNIEDIIKDEEGKKMMRERVEGFIKSSQNIHQYELDIKIPSGEEYILEVIGSQINPKKENSQVLITAYDITERIKAEQKILAQNEQYEALNEELQQTNEELLSTVKREEEINDRFEKAMEATSDGLFDWNLLTNEIYYTSRWKAMLGYKDNELPNDFSVWEKLTDPEDVKRSWNMMNALIDSKEEKFDIEFKMKHKDGHWVDIHSRADVFKDENGKAIRVVGTHTDISLKKKAEKELLLAKEKAEQANALKTEFLHNMSHEVRTPLNGIMGFCDLLTDLESCSDIHKHYTSIISNSGKQLLTVIDDILEISTLETKQTTIKEEVLDVNQFMMELFSIYDLKSKERKLPLYVFKELTNDNSFIRSDKAKLNKILSNLLDNAFKFTNSGKIEFGYSIQKPDIVFYVKDTGIGISADKQFKIFERFSQESSLTAQTYGGLGLGLSIAKENAELLGGTIRVESDKEKGTAFFVEIPYKLPLGTSTNQGNKVADFSNNTINMLVVEDEEVNYLYIEAVLEKFQERKVRLIHVVNGEEAVSRCLSDDTIDVVLMDIKMPVMNGYIATEKIKAVKPHLPVIAQTAYSTSAEKEKALDHGCDDFISKPIDKEELITLVQKFLNGDYS